MGKERVMCNHHTTKKSQPQQKCVVCGAVRNPDHDQNFIVLNPHYTKKEKQHLTSPFGFQGIDYIVEAPTQHFCSAKCFAEYLRRPDAQIAWAVFQSDSYYSMEARKNVEARPHCHNCRADLDKIEGGKQEDKRFKAVVAVIPYGAGDPNRFHAGPRIFHSAECLANAYEKDGFSAVGFWDRPEHSRCAHCGAVDRSDYGPFYTLNPNPSYLRDIDENFVSQGNEEPAHFCSAACLVAYLQGAPKLNWVNVTKYDGCYDACGHCREETNNGKFLAIVAPYGSIFDDNISFFCTIKCAIAGFQRDPYDAKREDGGWERPVDTDDEGTSSAVSAT